MPLLLFLKLIKYVDNLNLAYRSISLELESGGEKRKSAALHCGLYGTC